MSLRPATRTTLSCLVLVAAILLVYGRVLGHGFVAYDNPIYLTENPWVTSGLTLDGLRWAFTQSHASNWHPLTWISHMVDVELFGLRPGWHAFENVLWHAANAVLVLLALEKLTGAPGRASVVAALFALHPLHVESVAWIVERKDVLSTFFGLVCVLAWTSWARGGSRVAYGLALLCLALGLLAKPRLVTWPFVLLLLDLGPLGRRSVGLPKLLLEKSRSSRSSSSLRSRRCARNPGRRRAEPREPAARGAPRERALRVRRLPREDVLAGAPRLPLPASGRRLPTGGGRRGDGAARARSRSTRKKKRRKRRDTDEKNNKRKEKKTKDNRRSSRK